MGLTKSPCRKRSTWTTTRDPDIVLERWENVDTTRRGRKRSKNKERKQGIIFSTKIQNLQYFNSLGETDSGVEGGMDITNKGEEEEKPGTIFSTLAHYITY